MGGDDVAGSLAFGLSAVVSDPGRIGELHDLLGEFCHVFRNRLQSLNLSLYLARRGGAIPPGHLDDYYQRAERIIDQLQWICRPAELRPIRLTLGMLLEERLPEWSGWLAARGRRLEFAGGRECEGSFDPCRLATSLDAFAHWRAEAGPPGTTVRVGWRVERGHFALDWEEPEGTGPDPAEGEPDPWILALPMVARAMADHHGRLTSPRGAGFSLALRWPLESEARRASAPAERAVPARPHLTGGARRA